MDASRRTSPAADLETIRLLSDLYGIEGRVEPLPSEHDRNDLIVTPDGERYVLKRMRAGYDEDLLGLQTEAIEHLATRVPSLSWPRVRPTLEGQRVALTRDALGDKRFIWMLEHVDGRLLANVRPHSAALLASLGRVLGSMSAALADFCHPAANRELPWDLARAVSSRDRLDFIDDRVRRSLVDRFLDDYDAVVSPALPGLRQSVIHGDANDHNVLVREGEDGNPEVVGLVDFGDVVHTGTVFDLAIGTAYAILKKRDVVSAAGAVVAGYHREFPLTEEEVELLFPLICARLCMSVTKSAERKRTRDDPYITISENDAWEALDRLAGVSPRMAHCAFRRACDWPAVPRAVAVVDWLREQAGSFAPVLDLEAGAGHRVVDLSVGSRLLGANPAAAETTALAETVFGSMKADGAKVGIGRYGEARLLYSSPDFATGPRPTDERRTVHLGIDLFVEPGTGVHAPLDGEVECVAVHTGHRGFGPVVVLKHTTDEGDAFFTIYGHLDPSSIDFLTPGKTVSRGQLVGRVGAPPENGDWLPHLHFQLTTDLLGMEDQFPGVASATQFDLWSELSPDPNVILQIPADRLKTPEIRREQLLAGRSEVIGSSVRLSYDRPLEIVQGWMQYLYDETGRAYLDFYNNVAHVGHCHPRVVEAIQTQAALLNTNTRYLHADRVRYARRLTDRFPDPLNVCYLLNSASEANELALRLARAHTGQRDTIVLEAAYHGHTTTLVEVSPYKFDGPGGEGARPWVHVAPLADPYRGPFRRDDPEAGRKYALQVAEIVESVQAKGRGPAAFMAETLPSVGGQIVFPPEYLAEAYGHVRAAGGVCIADEVQVGFGRLGTHFWGFEAQGVLPDIVVLGKPIGNGHPLAAVVTTRELAASFDTGMEFFSTFGGNPVACAAGLAVLDVLEEERLQDNALRVGGRLLSGLDELKDRHPIVGDVRGSGLFVGVELVRDRETLEPADREASYVVNRMREKGVLAGTDGPFHNVVKIRPPMIVSPEDIELGLEIIDEVLGEDPAAV